ncbi:UTP--glucose-1-phosphate uridylyltransferase GalU [Luminiphilus sp.]|nr:UTP--glucose-1-phosphate uridylyltransferase GalU [Luminiphilus sp.]MDC6472322.1 UTP--glucose-1-phosphate uridylyltransferase GalU [Luminiphilus sp.]
MITKCLFPVAGYGTRFLPATKSMPKEMLPVVNKPLVQYGVEEAIEAGMVNCALVTGRGKRAIADHFDTSYELEHQIAGSEKEQYLESIRDVIDRGVFTMVRQRAMLGLGHAILTGEPLIGDQPFGVVLSDDLCLNDSGPGVLAQMAALYEEFQCSIVAVQEVPMADIEQYGVVAGAPEREGLTRVTAMVEKPPREEAPSNLAVIGRYILTPDIFDIIRNTPPGRNGEVQLTDALQVQASQGRVLAYRFQGQRFDCGSVPGFVEATQHVFEHYYGRDQ